MIIPALLLASVIALVLAMFSPDKKMISRDLGCANVNPAREKEICLALSKSMEWTWTGHAIISPGWRVTENTLRRVYCREKITSADLPALETMKTGSDWRLQDGAEDLIHLLGANGDRANPRYVREGGCEAVIQRKKTGS
jgi:hypothetical protein